MDNNDFIKLQTNSKQTHIELDLVNLPIDSCLRQKFYFITILIINTKFE